MAPCERERPEPPDTLEHLLPARHPVGTQAADVPTLEGVSTSEGDDVSPVFRANRLRQSKSLRLNKR
jgi:hypothetical protein